MTRLPMTNFALPPTVLTDQGRPMRVTRAWPRPEQARLSLECEDAGQRRAGIWDGASASLQPLGADARLADLEELARGGVVVSHRPGKRAVVRREDQFIKVVRRGRTRTILDGIERADAFTEYFRTPAVLAHTRSTVTFGALEGSSLHEPRRLGPQRWERAWAEVLSAWSRSVSSSAAEASSNGGSDLPGIPEHSADQEIVVLAHWARLVEPFVHPADQMWRSVERISEDLAQLPQGQLRPAHRDLHDKQLLWSPQNGPGLLDVDTACLADPALDLGNLRAHARLRMLQGIWERHAARTVVSAVDATAARLKVPGRSLAVYERAAVLRLGCVYAVRPAYVEVAAAMRAHVALP
ncbi:phosphotransferase [Nesterenkonia sp. LB17]|uniref:phosphotransferase family protein n=1 Tax=unclassified Nesterenkonia TaxID=2629769 RepID=UPI001F4CF8BC|nr:MULTISPECIES: phosphotransferase [unclassified Nesterenkonia]MCH8561969.1 phosphotransferase [Nesterenkonia sp. YGD6]MCH8564494.1 phosphotransferase [Nesterenkonia sp. LB17]MCH8570120.1 phosphotransferase [Nesterenkonia sp. AY15]